MVIVKFQKEICFAGDGKLSVSKKSIVRKLKTPLGMRLVSVPILLSTQHTLSHVVHIFGVPVLNFCYFKLKSLFLATSKIFEAEDIPSHVASVVWVVCIIWTADTNAANPLVPSLYGSAP